MTGRDNGFIRWVNEVSRATPTDESRATSTDENYQEKLHRRGSSPFTGTVTKEQRKKPFFSRSICSPE